MTFNEIMIKGRWLEIQGEIQQAWGKLTNDELDRTQGDIKCISGLLQQKYGEAQATYSRKVTDIFKRFEIKKDEVVNQIKNNLKH